MSGERVKQGYLEKFASVYNWCCLAVHFNTFTMFIIPLTTKLTRNLCQPLCIV